MKINKILFTFFVFSFANITFASSIEDIKLPKMPAYRVGTGNFVEKENIKKINTDNCKDTDSKTINEDEFVSYADLSLQTISKDIASQVDLEQNQILSDIKFLWQGAAMKSETIKFAIYKLSNPEADKPDEKIAKKIIKQVASFSTLAGVGIGNPVAATTAIMSGSLLGNFAMDDKQINYKYSKINDTDMVVLVKKIDNLQQNVISKYVEYVNARQILILNNTLLEKRAANYEKLKDLSKEQTIMADSYRRMALDRRDKARLEYLSKRAALEQLVGFDCFSEFEKDFLSRQEF